MTTLNPSRQQFWKIAVLVGIYFTVCAAAASAFVSGIDWQLTFRPATLALLRGESPYTAASVQAPFANAPWALVPLTPLALLPEAIGRGLLFAAAGLAFLIAAVQLGGKPPAVAAFLLSPPVMHSLLNANLDWMPILGFVLPPRWGLFLVAVKPQMGFVVAGYWLVEAWRRGGWRQAWKVFWPFLLTLAVSLAIFGLWPLNMLAVKIDAELVNASLWPASIPVGLALAVAALRTRRQEYAQAASPCLSPYLMFHSWSAALIALIRRDAEIIAAVIGLWIFVLIRSLSGG